MKKIAYAKKLLEILNKEHNTSFTFEDFRKIARCMDAKTKAVFMDSGGFSICAENCLNIISTSKRNNNLRNIAEVVLHEFRILIKGFLNYNKVEFEEADKYARENADRYARLLRRGYRV